MVLVYTYTPVPSNYYVTWVENDTHLELQVLILAPYLAHYKIFFKKNLIFPCFLSKASFFHSNGQQNFFFPTKEEITGGHLRACDSPQVLFYKRLREAGFGYHLIVLRIIGPLAGPPLHSPSPARHRCVPARFWIALTPMKGKVANRYEWTDSYKSKAV